MNIPRYVEADNDEIAQDVDAHLYGGIPKSNIDELLVLNKSVPEVINSSFEVLREGYLKLNKSMEQLMEEVINAPQVLAKNDELRKIAESFVAKYWHILRQVNLDSDLTSLMSEMLSEIKEEVSSIEFVDAYSAYQIVAEIWKDSLTKDSELIAASDFYTIGRKREPNMVTKGSGKNKRREQDGWISMLVPNELIAKRLFASEQEEIEALKNKAQEIESELSELVEAAKVEDSEEYEALYESLKKNEDDEPQDAFEAKTIKAELKRAEKGTPEFEWLKRVEKLLADKSSTNKSIKEKEKQLKEAVESKIENLTNEEIDMLVFEKWFAGTVDALVGLVEKPLRAELSTIALLEKRYAQTFNEIDAQVSELEKAFEALASELVVVVQITMGQSPLGSNYTENPSDYILVQGNADMKNGKVFPRIWTTQVTKTAEPDDIILSVRAPVGDVGKTDYNVVLGRGVAGIKGNEFIYQLLSKMKSNSYWGKYSTGSTFDSINSNDLKEANICIPSTNEQVQIGSFFRNLDQTIAFQQRKLEKMKAMKSAYLSEMFPAEGERKPKRCFPGFTDDWEQCELGDVVRTSSFKLYLSEASGSGKYPVIQQGDNPILGFSNNKPFERFEDVVLFGDHTLSLYKPAHPFLVATDGLKILSIDGFDNNFLYSLLEKYMPESEGYKRHFTILKSSKISFPQNIDERVLIGRFFTSFDQTIAFQQQKLEKLQNIKKAYLNEMFI